jgi:uncharacterized membrane protein
MATDAHEGRTTVSPGDDSGAAPAVSGREGSEPVSPESEFDDRESPETGDTEAEPESGVGEGHGSGGPPVGPFLTEGRKDTLFLIMVLAVIAAYFAFFGALSLLRIHNFRASGVDAAIFDQVLWLMSKLKGATSTIRGMNIFGDHMAPVLFFLVPLYWVKANLTGVLLLQTAALALGALPLYLIARDRLDSRWVALFIAGAYLAYPALEHMNLFDFHPETLAVCFLLFAVLAIERKRFVWFYVLCLGALICKEDMALAVFLLGLVVYFKYDKRAGKIVAVGSAVYFLVAIFLVIPKLGPEGFQYSGRLQAFGKSPWEAAKNMIFHPRHTFDVVATRQNLRYIFDLLIPVAFLCLISPVFLIPALPAFFINIISDFPGQHTILFQYTAALIPFIFVAVIFALRKFKNWGEGAFRPRLVVAGVTFVLAASALAGNFYLSPSPLSAIWKSSDYRSDAHIDVIREGLQTIPPDAPVSAQIYLIPHLSEREKIYMFPQPFIDLVDPAYFKSLQEDERKYMWPDIYKRLEPGVDKAKYPVPRVDYVALDRGVDPWPLTRDEYNRIVDRLLSDPDFVRVFDKQGVLVLKRRGAP